MTEVCEIRGELHHIRERRHRRSHAVKIRGETGGMQELLHIFNKG